MGRQEADGAPAGLASPPGGDDQIDGVRCWHYPLLKDRDPEHSVKPRSFLYHIVMKAQRKVLAVYFEEGSARQTSSKSNLDNRVFDP